ncbi:MAG: hypothetical protein HC778_00665 [Chamaesiphon sp. CSU_1_12]|nr:hypothetical protein [Chamaesiphon sp. CSU_1_12]
MEDKADTKTYRKLLAQRNGKCFSEAEVTNILEQMLSQLESLHHQGYSHGGLSLDTLAQQDDRVVLLSPPNISPQPSISQDIYNSGLIAIELLTAKTPSQLRNGDGSWNWEDYCFISDRLTGTLNRMLAEFPSQRFQNVDEILSALNSSAFFTTPPPSPIQPPTFENIPIDNKVAVPAPRSIDNSTVQNIPVQPTQIPRSQRNKEKPKADIPVWQLGLIGLASTVMVVSVGLGIWKLIEPEAPIFSYLAPSKLSPISNNENALFAIQRDGKRGYIDKTGKVLINPDLNISLAIVDGILDIDGKCNTNESVAIARFTPKFNRSAAIREGLISIEVNGKCGYIDKTGKVLINPQFDDASSFSEGLAAVKIGDRYGYIDKTGQSIINPQFLLARPFTEGLAAVNVGSKVGYVDRTGKLVINPQFEWAREFSEGLAAIKVDERYGYIDPNGK